MENQILNAPICKSVRSNNNEKEKNKKQKNLKRHERKQ